MYNGEIYRVVKDRIEARRLAAVGEADRRNAEVRARSAEIAAIDDELTGTGLKLFRAALLGEDITLLRERNQYLCGKRGEALAALGLPDDYTEIHYSCPVCMDTGYADLRMCECMRRELVRESIRQSGIGDLIEKQNFDNFDLHSYKEDGEEVYKRMCRVFEITKNFAENFDKMKGNLFFFGTTGTGKTHLSSAIAGVVIDKGFSVIYDSTQNVIEAFEDEKFHAGYGENEHKTRKYLECDLLILDDLGTEFSTPFAVSALYNLLNTRRNRALSTVVSTNLSASDIVKRYDDRIYSRLIGADTVSLRFEGHDHRLPR